jgi:hypothetical protein
MSRSSSFSIRCCAALFLALAGCGGNETSAGGGTVTTTHPGAKPLPGETACTVTEDVDIPVPSRNHVPVCSSVTYDTNPPSGGDHWPIWAAYRIYQETVVPREMYVHDLEHGGIVFLFRCSGSCTDVVDALTTAFDGMPADPLCDGMAPTARHVLTADPDLATPIAAAAWGATYTATCIDPPSLAKFARDHYAQGPEDFCTDGLDIEGQSNVCADGGL